MSETDLISRRARGMLNSSVWIASMPPASRHAFDWYRVRFARHRLDDALAWGHPQVISDALAALSRAIERYHGFMPEGILLGSGLTRPEVVARRLAGWRGG
jgi:hypothetical protein